MKYSQKRKPSAELSKQHALERQELMRDMSHIKGYEKESFHSEDYSKFHDKDHKPDLGFDGGLIGTTTLITNFKRSERKDTKMV